MRLLAAYELAPPLQAAIAPLRPWSTLHFDPTAWHPLRQATARQLGCRVDELGMLHALEAAQARGVPLKSRRRTTGKHANVAALKNLQTVYEDFVCDVVAPHVAEHYCGHCDEVLFQAMPSLRVVVPGAKPAGKRHRDGAYGHQPGQINWWLPLSPAYGNNTLWLEPPPGASVSDVGAGTERLRSPDAWPLEGSFGTLHRFHGHACFHFTRPNDTPATRVSLDFRVVPGPCFDNDWPGSRSPLTGAQSFFVGGYYARASLEGTRWSVDRDTAGTQLRGNVAKRATRHPQDSS